MIRPTYNSRRNNPYAVSGSNASRAELMTAELLRPKGNLQARTGELEMFAPLFRGTDASPQNEMFPEGV
jgi:hypothetical protein